MIKKREQYPRIYSMYKPVYILIDFVSCFHCATLPHKARYVHDEHLLTFSYEENANDHHDQRYWCDICERKIKIKTGLYACNECEITVHVDCLLGKDPYLKSGQSFTSKEGSISAQTVNVLPNTYSTRPKYRECGKRCPYKILIEFLFIMRSRMGTFS
ncbi:unnamed protein product [Thlaspi arvense]|uniref:Phorbol-ester/DAG-type domain-containing protein n=1 Tax=Thlaspi arvense TaxID=13288 RepID=A0AAU9SDN4_THLAR|nr:unnamed protein product [Thlaspi arvense]